MGLKFRKSIKLGKGAKLNLGKKSIGMSFGGKHGGISFNSKSGTRVRASIPGTGISYSTKLGGTSKKSKKATPQNSYTTVPVEVNAQTYLTLTTYLGWLGIHRFYRKDYGMGLFYILTFGGFAIGWIYDIIVARKMISALESDKEPEE